MFFWTYKSCLYFNAYIVSKNTFLPLTRPLSLSIVFFFSILSLLCQLVLSHAFRLLENTCYCFEVLFLSSTFIWLLQFHISFPYLPRRGLQLVFRLFIFLNCFFFSRILVSMKIQAEQTSLPTHSIVWLGKHFSAAIEHRFSILCESMSVKRCNKCL